MANLQERLRNHMVESNLTQTDVAKAMGVSNGLISAYLGGKYNGNSETTEKRIEEYLNTQLVIKEKAKVTKKDFDFVPTSVYGTIEAHVKSAILEKGAVLIIGASGVGKTTALKHLKGNDDALILIKVRPLMTASCILDHILDELGIGLDRIPAGYNRKLDKTLSKLEGSNRTIVVDEAEHLGLKVFETLRFIQDETDCGLVFCGTPDLSTLLYSARQQYPHLYNRTGIPVSLKVLTENDVEQMASQIDQHGIPAATWRDACKGIGRDLLKIVKVSENAATLPKNESKPFEHLIKKATGIIYDRFSNLKN